MRLLMNKIKQTLILAIIAAAAAAGGLIAINSFDSNLGPGLYPLNPTEHTTGRISHPPNSLFRSEALRYNSHADSQFFEL